MPGSNTSAPSFGSVSAAIAAANALLTNPSESGPRFPGEDGGRSLAEMALADLDATLQLLAERAQYITGASGAAIALRRDSHNDMLCRASSGDNAPQLGANLSMDYGLSGESVRTRQLMRCDDAERDPRVNREVCRELGIASVLVMPILSDEKVLGVFELFSATANAFDERDQSALLRLSEMVATSVVQAASSHGRFAVPEISAPASQLQLVVPDKAPQPESSTHAVKSTQGPELLPHKPANAKPEEVESASSRTPFWSATTRVQNGESPQEKVEALNVPPALRSLQKCQDCGFPVSRGRALCVECEEKQWRNQAFLQDQNEESLQNGQALPPEGKNPAASAEVLRNNLPGYSSQVLAKSAALNREPGIFPRSEAIQTQELKPPSAMPAAGENTDTDRTNLGSTLQPESGIAFRNYILGALLIIAIIIGAIAWLR